MSTDTIVKLEATCDRTGKTETLEVTIAEAQDFQTIRDQKSASAEKLEADLLKIPEDKMPDLILAYKGKVVILGNINPKSDDAMARLLHDVTRNGTIFPKPSVKKRIAKDSKVEDNNASSTTDEVPFAQPAAG